ncbi:hypothetical protein K8S17_05180 [bacterium]|nr:hypothetical protein [bacterium]
MNPSGGLRISISHDAKPPVISAPGVVESHATFGGGEADITMSQNSFGIGFGMAF